MRHDGIDARISAAVLSLRVLGRTSSVLRVRMWPRHKHRAAANDRLTKRTPGACDEHARAVVHRKGERAMDRDDLNPVPSQYRSRIQVAGGGCWIWVGRRLPAGYGRLGRGYAHRAIYELVRGAIPAGLSLDHLCRRPSCVNPAHLEAVDMRTNILRGHGAAAVNARKVCCARGHPLEARARGGRHCPVCRRLRWRAENGPRRLRRLAEGRCVWCSKMAAPGRAKCASCLVRSRERDGRYRARKRGAA